MIIVDSWAPQKGDVIRQKLHWLFDKFGFKLEIQTNLEITSYLNITFNLFNGTVFSLRENKPYPCYIHVSSYHHIFKHIPNGIMFRLSTNSSDTNVFTQNKHNYELVLKIVIMLHSHNMATGNVHRMFVTHIGIPKHEKLYDFLVQVRNFLLPLSLKVFRHKERGTIFLCWLFHLPPPITCGARSTQIRLASPRSQSQLTDFSQISAHASGAWRH